MSPPFKDLGNGKIEMGEPDWWDGYIVKEAVDYYIDVNLLKKVKGIGYKKGETKGGNCMFCKQDRPMRDSEGLICQMV